MALGPCDGLHTRKLPFVPRSIGCLVNQEETFVSGIKANEIGLPMLLGPKESLLSREGTYGPRAVGWPSY